VAINAAAGPLVTDWIYCHIYNRISMVFTLRFSNYLASLNIINITGPVLTTRHQILETIANSKTYVETPVGVTTHKLAHWTSNTQIPQLNRVVSSTSQKRIERVMILVGSFIELNSVGVALMRVVDNLNCSVFICIEDNQLSIRSSHYTNLARHFSIVKSE